MYLSRDLRVILRGDIFSVETRVLRRCKNPAQALTSKIEEKERESMKRTSQVSDVFLNLHWITNLVAIICFMCYTTK